MSHEERWPLERALFALAGTVTLISELLAQRPEEVMVG